VDGKVVATKKMTRSTPLLYNLDDTFSIGTSGPLNRRRRVQKYSPTAISPFCPTGC